MHRQICLQPRWRGVGPLASTVLVAVILFGVGSARADSIFGMSFFGPDVTSWDARMSGRAGTGIAYRDSMNAAVSTPTQLADLKLVTVSLTTNFERRGAEDSAGDLTRLGLSTPTVRIGFPLFGHGGFGFGYQARRATQWQVVRPFPGDATVTENIEREGTQFTIPFELAWRFGDHVTVGGGLNLERGTVRVRYLLDIEDPGAVDPLEVREDVYSSTAPELALALHELGPFSLAGFWVGEHDADVDIRQRGVALSNRDDASRTDTLPARFGVGVRYDLPGPWSTGVDFRREKWSDYRGRIFRYDAEGRFDPAGSEVFELEDEDTWSFGLEKESRPRGLRHTTPWRAGAYWRRWHYALGGSELKEWGVTVGTGLVLRAGWARTDVAVGYSHIGNLDDNGAAESVWKLSFSVAGGERWY